MRIRTCQRGHTHEVDPECPKWKRRCQECQREQMRRYKSTTVYRAQDRERAAEYRIRKRLAEEDDRRLAI